MVLRGHGLYLFLSDSILMRGMFLAIKFAAWQRSASNKIEALVAAVAELDAIVSMGELRSEGSLMSFSAFSSISFYLMMTFCT